jgi:hypothetical protein
MLDFAGLCGTMLDHLRGTRGMIGRSRMTDRCMIRKKWAPLWKLGAMPTITASSWEKTKGQVLAGNNDPRAESPFYKKSQDLLLLLSKKRTDQLGPTTND